MKRDQPSLSKVAGGPRGRGNTLAFRQLATAPLQWHVIFEEDETGNKVGEVKSYYT